MAQPEVLNTKVQVGVDPARFASLTTARLLATTVYVVALIDHTGRLADPATLKTTTDPRRAQRLHVALMEKCGGKVTPTYKPPPDPPKRDRAHDRAPGNSPRHRPAQPVYQPTFGTWLMKFRHKGRDYRERFPTEREAIAYRDKIMEEQ